MICSRYVPRAILSKRIFGHFAVRRDVLNLFGLGFKRVDSVRRDSDFKID